MIKRWRQTLSFLKPLANRYIGFLLFFIVYTLVVEQVGGLPSIHEAWRLEIPLLLYLYFYFNRITRKSWFQPLVAALPIVLIYFLFDTYHLLYGRLLRVAEVTELPELVKVMSLKLKIVAMLVVGGPLVVFAASIQWRRVRPILVGLVPLLALVIAVEYFPDSFMKAFEKTQKPIEWMSDVESVGHSGRLSMTMYNEARRKSSLIKTAAYRGNSTFIKAFDNEVQKVGALGTKNNIHLIVLESFLDPNLFRKLQLSRNPEHPAFTALFKNKGGLSISPVFGGATAQAEFEVLCGVPAMRELSGIEFDVFTGAKTLCLPNILAQGGYHTIATNAFYPDFFNSTNAYTGLGFQKIYYPGEYMPGCETYLSTGDVTDEFFMFDGNLLPQNLAFVADWIKNNPGKPLLNYIMTVYGHTPHLINTDKRPMIIKASGMGQFFDDQLERAVNQYYYRTEALAEYVKGLMQIDPKSIIILVSDHVPPLLYGPNTYRDLDYLGKMDDYIHMNRVYIIENGRPIQLKTIHHYDIPQIIISYLTHTKFEPTLTAKATSPDKRLDLSGLRDHYMTIMAHAMDYEPSFFDFGHSAVAPTNGK
ncbi:MAG: sulfatase-like hydrolase/transferase [Desulfobacteraceae bacterium]|nr:sulfatase-like hydrolase/transferase [Desulfobacteraceae bacterium]